MYFDFLVKIPKDTGDHYIQEDDSKEALLLYKGKEGAENCFGENISGKPEYVCTVG